jgi:hypothetical protein
MLGEDGRAVNRRRKSASLRVAQAAEEKRALRSRGARNVVANAVIRLGAVSSRTRRTISRFTLTGAFE